MHTPMQRKYAIIWLQGVAFQQQVQADGLAVQRQVQGGKKCATPCLYEQRIKEMFLEALTDCSRINGESEEVAG